MRAPWVLAILAVTALAGCQDAPELDFYRIDAGIQTYHQASQDAGFIVVGTDDVWEAFWEVHTGGSSEAPPVDFDTRFVLALFAGERPTTGYGISVSGLEYFTANRTYVVDFVQATPDPDCPAADVITHPFDIVAISRVDDRPIQVEPRAAGGYRVACS